MSQLSVLTEQTVQKHPGAESELLSVLRTASESADPVAHLQSLQGAPGPVSVVVPARMSEREARGAVAEAFETVIGRRGSLVELQCLQAIGSLETGYGSSWRGTGVGSFNMGAIQAGSGWLGPVFSYTDTHPNKDGTSTPYETRFRKYRDAAEGFADLCRSVYTAFDRAERVLPAAGAADLIGFSLELHRPPCYYEGFGDTDAERVAHHHAAVVAAITRQCRALSEAFPSAVNLPPIVPALLLGATGEAVKYWQKVVGAAQDGEFGHETQMKTRAWQFRHHMPPSGIVGSEELSEAAHEACGL